MEISSNLPKTQAPTEKPEVAGIIASAETETAGSIAQGGGSSLFNICAPSSASSGSSGGSSLSAMA